MLPRPSVSIDDYYLIIALSYVIQHFYQPISVSRVTYRKYYNWLYRNTPLIVTLMEYTSFCDYLILTTTNPILIRPEVIRMFFKGGLKKLFSKLILRWRPVRESQHVRGVEYWAYKTALKSFKGGGLNLGGYNHKTALAYSSVHFYNQCFFEHRYVIFSLHKKYYRIVMLEFLHLILRGWQLWRHELNYSLNLIVVATEFSLLGFFNSRFFKTLAV